MVEIEQTPDAMIAARIIETGLERISVAIDRFRPVKVFGLLSGGHDSLTATEIASRHPAFSAAVHIRTGIGVKETFQFVRETCAERGWPLLVYSAAEHVRGDGTPDPQIYRNLVLDQGFPGPAHHGKMYQRLKERQLERLVRDHKKFYSRQCVLLVSGRRSQESARRGRTVVERERDPRAPGRAWVNPIHDISKIDTSRVIAAAGLRRNPVVDLIHKSGECLCGAFAEPGELEELKLWFPETWAEIMAIQADVLKKFPWGWGQRPVKVCPKKMSGRDLALCHNCTIKQK